MRGAAFVTSGLLPQFAAIGTNVCTGSKPSSSRKKKSVAISPPNISL
jgi:hypothetical protein